MQLSPCRRATWESSVAVLVVWTETKHFTWRLIQTGEMKNGVNGCFCVNSHLLISCLWKIWYHGFVEAGGVLWRSHSTGSARAGSPEQVVQHSAYTGSEYPQRRAVHHLSAQPVPVLPFIKVSIMWRHPVVTCWTSIAVYQSSQCVVRWNSCARYFAWSSLYWLCLLQTSWVFPCPLKSVVWL